MRTIVHRDRSLHAPFFQRTYCWDSTLLKPFLEDVEAVSKSTGVEHFFGALVLHEAKTAVGEEKAIFWVIDGQQRLISTMLLILAIYQANPDSEKAQRALDYWDVGEEDSSEAKLLPTYRDRQQVKEVFEAVGLDKFHIPDQGGSTTGHLMRAWKYISQWYKRYLARSTDDEAKKCELSEQLLEGLLDRMRVVEIIIPHEMDSTQVFQSINGNSRRLTVGDLTRSLVAMTFSTDQAKDAEQFFTAHWQPFEARVGDKDLGDFLFVYGLQHEEKPSTSALYEFLKGRWGGDDETEEWTGRQIVDDLNLYVPAYNWLVKSEVPSQFEGRDARGLRSKMETLRRFEPSAVSRSYLVRLLYETQIGTVELSTAADTLVCIENFLTRRALANIEPTGLHALFKTLWDTAGADKEAVIEEIKRRSSLQTPSDGEITEKLKTKSFYSNKKKRFVLFEWELHQTDRTTAPTELFDSGHVDHIMPTASEGQAEWHAAGSKKEREDAVDLIGNLVLIESEENSSKGAEAWKDVVPRYRNQTRSKAAQNLLERTRKRNGKVRKEEVKSWTVGSIHTRSKEMAKWACERWPDDFT